MSKELVPGSGGEPCLTVEPTEQFEEGVNLTPEGNCRRKLQQQTRT
jgi:hypothetical protein